MTFHQLETRPMIAVRAVVRRLREHRRVAVVLFHLLLIAFSSYAAIWLRFDGRIPGQNWQPWFRALPWLLLVRALTFAGFRLNRGLWRYTGIWDLRNIVGAVVLSSVAQYLLVHWAFGWTGYPRVVFVIDAAVLILLMGGVRMTRGMVTELRRVSGERRVLVYGAGDAGAMIVREMRNRPGELYRPVGFIDDDPAKVGLRIHGVPVLGTREALSAIVKRYRPHEVLIAIPRAEPATMQSVVLALEPLKIPIKTLPNLRDLIDGKVELTKIRRLSAEDLLARAPVGLDIKRVKSLFAGRRVMVTGAGGSIGSELCRQIASLKPAALVMFDRYENTLNAIQLELNDQKNTFGVVSVIGDVTDESRVNAVLAECQPEIIFHAAAHKHVPLMEGNPCEAVKNNVRGTRVLAQAADAHGVDRFIMISTDKAVNPTSVMGASKRVAELVVQEQTHGSGTAFSIVRFGNVLGSNGSVVPRFMEQIKNGGPLTVTHPDMRRFFMLIPEAVQLVLLAASQAESGTTYVLEMGQQVKVLDMARALIHSSGLVPDDIKIEFTGLRPGEKLFEELVGPDEEASPSAVENILCVRSRRVVGPDFLASVNALELDAARGNTGGVLTRLKALTGTVSPDGESSGSRLQAPMVVQSAAAAGALAPDEQPCPQCRTGRIRRSHSRSIPERIKKGLRPQRLFRCSDCGWRGWLDPMKHQEQMPVEAVQTPDLTSLDSAFMGQIPFSRPSFSPRNLG